MASPSSPSLYATRSSKGKRRDVQGKLLDQMSWDPYHLSAQGGALFLETLLAVPAAPPPPPPRLPLGKSQFSTK